MTEKLENLAVTPIQQPETFPTRGDVLSEVLDIVHVHGDRAMMIATDSPRTVSFPHAMPCFHIVEHGTIAIRIESEPDAITVGANQLALLLHGQAHHVDYGAAGKVVQRSNKITDISDLNSSQSETGKAARCFWGSFSLYGDLAESVLRGLPQVIVIRDLKQDPVDWLEMVCQIILDETREKHPGASVMVSRLLDLMLVQILRRWARDAETAPGWLASLQDHRVSRAVTAIHNDPAQDWSVEALAGLCGMSRSSFVTLFEKVMNQTPGAYLREWRLARAAKLLRYSGSTIDVISQQVGYTSKEAFSRAFRKHFGKSPSTWRGTT